MKSKKSENFSEWYTELVKEAKLADIRYNVKGFVVFLPWSVMSMMRMYRVYEAELEKTGHVPAWFPAVIPERNFHVEAKHVEGFTPQVFWVSEAGGNKLEERLAMRPTSETAMYQMYALWVQGKADLPIKIYHSSQVWRYETKATRPFIRSREFHWIEAHDAFASEAEAKAQVREDMEIAQKAIHEKFCVPFLFFRRPQWDKFPGAVDTFAADTLMPDGKVLQLPSTHLLGQNFAKAFNITYTDEAGKQQFAWQTCYGPAISRIYAAVISVNGDDKGLVLPSCLATLTCVIVPIVKKETEKQVLEACAKVRKILEGAGIKCRLDDSANSPGFKYNEWELKGVPVRIEVGAREAQEETVTIAMRDIASPKEKKTVKVGELVGTVGKLLLDFDARIFKKSDEQFKGKIHDAKDLKQLEGALGKGGFARIAFCSMEMDGKNCADELKAKTTGDVRGTIFGGDFEKKEKPDAKTGTSCIVCGKAAKEVVYAARQY
ncbi:proline--tRNA ligase [Candidatus Parvarchaeota archaeon]|nr:proline--tRNA ligase [Candidatus Parvarchaeota archaeon]